MNLAIKKIELIEWLAGVQDEKIIKKIEAFKKSSARNLYDLQMPKSKTDLQAKINRSIEDIRLGQTHKQKDVESFFRTKFTK